MTTRYVYVLDLSKLDHLNAPAIDVDLQMRPARQDDLHALAELMLDSYRGTIDYDDETLEDAIGEVQAYLSRERDGGAWLNESRLGFVDDRLVAACLTGEWRERQRPLIAYVMTCADWKKRGVGKLVVWAVLQELARQGQREVFAVITEGNTPSERLFARLGFQRVAASI